MEKLTVNSTSCITDIHIFTQMHINKQVHIYMYITNCPPVTNFSINASVTLIMNVQGICDASRTWLNDGRFDVKWTQRNTFSDTRKAHWRILFTRMHLEGRSMRTELVHLIKHIATKAKWVPFCKRHIQANFSFYGNCGILIQMSLTCISNGPIDNNIALVKIMSWR